MITAAPPGSVWCGVDVTVGQMNVYGPGTSFVGVNPVGLGATFLTVPRDTIEPTLAEEHRRLDSRKIVLACLEHVDSTGCHQPSMAELRRAACASESRVRQAFVELLDAPPNQYFRFRLLSRLRDDLLHADPHRESVTRIASSLGVTQLGRIAGRYRQLFDELPSDTLRR